MPATQRILKAVPKAAAEPIDPLLTPAQVAAWLGITIDAVRKKAARGKLAAIRIDARNMRFKRADIEALIQTRPSVTESWGE